MNSQTPPGFDRTASLQGAVGEFAALLERADGGEPVPDCPGWNVHDLALHLGSVHRWAAAIVLSGQDQRTPKPLVRGELYAWYAGTGAALLSALRAVDSDEPTPNFARVDERAGFWTRRQLHETTVHLRDLAEALGAAPPPLSPALAADGVDEVLTVFFPRLTARGSTPDVRAGVRLCATDSGDEWIVGPAVNSGEPPMLLPADASFEATIEGTAADLYLALWRRVTPDRLTVDGDAGHFLLDGPTSV